MGGLVGLAGLGGQRVREEGAERSSGVWVRWCALEALPSPFQAIPLLKRALFTSNGRRVYSSVVTASDRRAEV